MVTSIHGPPLVSYERRFRFVISTSHQRHSDYVYFWIIVHYATSAMKRFLTSVSLQHEPKASDIITLVKKTFFARVSYEILYHEVWNKRYITYPIYVGTKILWIHVYLCGVIRNEYEARSDSQTDWPNNYSKSVCIKKFSYICIYFLFFYVPIVLEKSNDRNISLGSRIVFSSRNRENRRRVDQYLVALSLGSNGPNARF